jgi:hypothetical protein
MKPIIELLGRIGGARPLRLRSPRAWVAFGIWWVVLFALAYATIGRGTKFIYVDF